jgi:low affinity Fe/Cu permease
VFTITALFAGVLVIIIAKYMHRPKITMAGYPNSVTFFAYFMDSQPYTQSNSYERSPMSKKKDDMFNNFTSTVSAWLGRPWIFVLALILLIAWAATGPLLGFSDTWQLVINTSTTIVTFLMVFIIQNTQNRDNMAMNIKMDVMMKKLGINEKDLIEAEDDSDKRLEKRVDDIKRRSEKSGHNSSKSKKRKK